MDEISIPQKQCSICGEYYPPTAEYFNNCKGIKCGFSPSCKTCINAKARNKYHEDIEASRLDCREKQERNRDKVRQSSRDWNAKNRDKMTQTMREWRQNNPDRARIIKQERRARIKELPHDFTASQRRSAIDYFNGCCPVCGRQFNDLFGNRTVAIDHFWIAESHGGGFTANNVIPLCHGLDGCNNSKQDKPPLVWLEQKFGKRKAKTIMNRIVNYFEWVNQCE